jgi:nitroreductase
VKCNTNTTRKPGPPYKQRRVETGKKLYGALNIAREDKEKQRQQWAANYRGFDAPLVLFFWMDNVLETGSYLDYGMFLQNIMLLATEHGLATCPQGALGEYPDIVRQTLNMPDDKILIGGMAIGYEDTSHPVNQYRTEREPVENFTQFYD